MKDDLKSWMKDTYKKLFNFETSQPYAAIHFSTLPDSVSPIDRQEIEVLEFSSLYLKIQNYLNSFNTYSKKPMNLVFVQYTIEHLIHVLRILGREESNGLLLGIAFIYC